MAVTQRIDLRQSQSLVMTPQLQQAIKLLELSNVELAAFVEQELETNPLLERDDEQGFSEAAFGSESDPAGAEAEAEAWEDAASFARSELLPDDAASPLDTDYDNLWDGETAGGALAFAGGEDRGGRADFSGGDASLEDRVAGDVTLRAHLLNQLGIALSDPGDRLIGAALIDMLDEAGYLTGDLAELAATLGCPVARIETVLQVIQQFDPVGVGARNLAECLAAQLKERDRLDPAMQALLDNLPLLASRDRAALMQVCGVDAEDLAEMMAEIRALNPKPALAFGGEAAPPVVPDIVMHRDPSGGWRVELNAETLPRVLVNNSYVARVNRQARGKSERDYVTERLNSANWLVKSLHQRATTILKVASEIVRRQNDFFLHGVQHMKPLIRRDIAEAIGMHESTVSRVTTNKYIATPRGVFELRYFFTAAIADSRGGEAHSAEAVRSRIKGLIGTETEVLSDDQIVARLKGDGIDIARRTVAKYRESLNIPSSVQRRRERALRRA